MDKFVFVDAVRRVLSPAMTSRGFGDGGPGWSPDGSATFLYCTGAQEFAMRWPAVVDLVRAQVEVDLDEPRACLDFEVEISDAGALVRLALESVELESLLASAPLDRLAPPCSLDELRRLDSTEAVMRLRAAVEVLLPLDRPR